VTGPIGPTGSNSVLTEVAGLEDLPVPGTLPNFNEYLVGPRAGTNDSVLVVKGSSAAWEFPQYVAEIQFNGSSVGTATAGGTINTVVSTSSDFTSLTDTANPVGVGTHIIQFLTGALAGLPRFVTSVVGSTVTAETPWASAPSVGDTFKIYKRDLVLMNSLEQFSFSKTLKQNTGINYLARLVRAGTRAVREYSDITDGGTAGLTPGTISEAATTFNAQFTLSPTPTNVLSCTTTVGSDIILTANTSSVSIGDNIAGVGIPVNSWVIAINAGVSFTINNLASANGTVTLTSTRYWVRDRSNAGDHSYLRRINESYEEEIWFSDNTVAATGVLWQLRSRIQLITGQNHLYGILTVTQDPSTQFELATKGYVDATAQGLNIKDPVHCAANGVNVVLSGVQTIDGFLGTAGVTRVLLAYQAVPSENGIWIMQTGAWTRSTDTNNPGVNSAPTATNMIRGYTFVANGNNTTGTSWVMTTNPYTLDTTALVWTQFFAAGSITASQGLQKIGSDIQTKLNPSDLRVNGTTGDLEIQPAITGHTYDGLTLTSNAVGFSISGGSTAKNLVLNNSLSFSGTDGSTLNIGGGGTLGTAAYINFVNAGRGVVDFNTSTRPTGVYAVEGAGSNGPGLAYPNLIHCMNSNDLAFQIAGGYTTDKMYFRGGYNLTTTPGWTTWREIIHSGNISSQSVYSSTLVNSVLDGGIVNNQSGASGWIGRIISKNVASDSSVAIGTCNGLPSIASHNYALTAWKDLYVNTVDGSGGGTIRMPGGIVITPGTINATSFVGTASNATTFIGNWTNWVSYRSQAVANMLGWKAYGNNHVIFDASAGSSPTGSAVNNTNAQIPWAGSYPTLMGWNGVNTFGVRVDSARVADNGISKFISTILTVPTAVAQAQSVAHGLGAVPALVRLVAVCKVAGYGYAVGDEAEVLCGAYDNGNVQLKPWASATYVGWSSGSNMMIINRSLAQGNALNIINLGVYFGLRVYAYL
jgi:hypothetical protein